MRLPLVILLSLIAGATCGIICNAYAADPGACMTEGEMFGPCFGDNTCADGLDCYATGSGWICSPPMPDDPNDDSISKCGSGVGPVLCDPQTDQCLVTCAADPDVCKAGTVCDESTWACVWPIGQVAGECLDLGGPFGRCNEGPEPCAQGLVCIATAIGSACLPGCEGAGVGEACGPSCADAFGTACDPTFDGCVQPCHVDADCLPGQVCDPDLGACLWP